MLAQIAHLVSLLQHNVQRQNKSYNPTAMLWEVVNGSPSSLVLFNVLSHLHVQYQLPGEYRVVALLNTRTLATTNVYRLRYPNICISEALLLRLGDK